MSLLNKLLLLVAITFLVSLYSCESCLECRLEYLDDQTNRDTTIVRVQCGKKADREGLEDYIKDKAEENNGTYQCMIKEF